MSIPTETLYKLQLRNDAPAIKPGDTVRVHQKIKEKGKERIQVFEGVVIARKHGDGISGTMTVRKVVEGVGVERIFPLHAPFISKIEVVASGKVRRSKLYYLRHAKGRKGRIKRKEFSATIAEEKPLEQEEAIQESHKGTDASRTEDAPEPTPAQEETK